MYKHTHTLYQRAQWIKQNLHNWNQWFVKILQLSPQQNTQLSPTESTETASQQKSAPRASGNSYKLSVASPCPAKPLWHSCPQIKAISRVSLQWARQHTSSNFRLKRIILRHTMHSFHLGISIKEESQILWKTRSCFKIWKGHIYNLETWKESYMWYF